jgi:hypothetical protein
MPIEMAADCDRSRSSQFDARVDVDVRAAIDDSRTASAIRCAPCRDPISGSEGVCRAAEDASSFSRRDADYFSGRGLRCSDSCCHAAPAVGGMVAT